jgi:hypothetical protein
MSLVVTAGYYTPVYLHHYNGKSHVKKKTKQLVNFSSAIKGVEFSSAAVRLLAGYSEGLRYKD